MKAEEFTQAFEFKKDNAPHAEITEEQLFDIMEQYANEKVKEALLYGYEIGVQQDKVINDDNVETYLTKI